MNKAESTHSDLLKLKHKSVCSPHEHSWTQQDTEGKLLILQRNQPAKTSTPHRTWQLTQVTAKGGR